MTIIDILSQNAEKYPDEVALVEINPKFDPEGRITWREYALMQPEPGQPFRREITWIDFERKANRFANLLFTRGCKKGDKVAILLMNSIEWLPIYFGILKAGAIAVPLNYRYTAEEIKYCLKKADCSMLVFGPEFIGRVEEICNRIPDVKSLFYVGEQCPSFADSYNDSLWNTGEPFGQLGGCGDKRKSAWKNFWRNDDTCGNIFSSAQKISLTT